eukprot:TRINITY_DN4214_c0_g1_i1.p1 TRINITY_DN4214_c0_g1~~TRINITY_DN4214_c0_g1_i1.p1  ORF type:complete len:421 (-),score=81.70 TRINITY_DN4214_c0_g1_i1:20-1282(-)
MSSGSVQPKRAAKRAASSFSAQPKKKGKVDYTTWARPRPISRSGPSGGVLIIASETQALKILLHFGPPSFQKRKEPQQLLAIPCPLLKARKNLRPAVAEALDPRLAQLAQKLRPDLGNSASALRDEPFWMVMEQVGTDIHQLTGRCVVAALTLPASLEEIQACKTEEEQKWKKEVCACVDLVVTSTGDHQIGDVSPMATANRALRNQCQVAITDSFWDEDLQLAVRRSLGIGIPLSLVDARGTRIRVLLLPEDASIQKQNELLCISEAVPETTQQVEELPQPIPQQIQQQIPQQIQQQIPQQFHQQVQHWEPQQFLQQMPQQVQHWEPQQFLQQMPQQNETMGAMPDGMALPPGWAIATSRSTGRMYYYNEITQEATFQFPVVEQPLPPGWTKQVSKSTGRMYYFHTASGQSTFEFPTFW